MPKKAAEAAKGQLPGEGEGISPEDLSNERLADPAGESALSPPSKAVPARKPRARKPKGQAVEPEVKPEGGKPGEAAGSPCGKVDGCEGGNQKLEKRKPVRTKREKSNKQEVENGGDLPAAEGAKNKCFAKRRRPSGTFPSMKWDSMRQAFQQKVKPLLSTYSAHEDCLCARILSDFLWHVQEYFTYMWHVHNVCTGSWTTQQCPNAGHSKTTPQG